MSNTQQHQPQAHVQLPPTLDSSDAKLVFLYLQIKKEATINELHRGLGMKKLTLYSVLETLTATDLVKQTGTTYLSHQQTGGAP